MNTTTTNNAKKRVTFLQSIASADWAFRTGEVANIPAELAAAWEASGIVSSDDVDPGAVRLAAMEAQLVELQAKQNQSTCKQF